MSARNRRANSCAVRCVCLLACLLTLSGCGRAGYGPSDIAPLPAMPGTASPLAPTRDFYISATMVAQRTPGSRYTAAPFAPPVIGPSCPPAGPSPTPVVAAPDDTSAMVATSTAGGGAQTFPGPCVDRWYNQPLAFAPDGTALAIGGSVALALHDPASGARRWAVPLPTRATALAFAPDGGTLAVGLTDGRVLLCRAADGALVRTLASPQKPSGFSDLDAVGPLAFSPDGLLLAAGYGGFAALWTLAATVPPAIVNGSAGGVGSLAFAADGATLLITQAGQAHDLGLAPAYLYRRRVAERAASDSWPLPPLNAARLTGSGPTLAAASDRGVALWTLDLAPTAERTAPAPRERRDAPAPGPYGGSATAMQRLVFSPRGDFLVGATSAYIFLWDVATATPAGAYPVPGSSNLNGVAVASGGAVVVAAFADRTVHLWRR